MLNILLAKHNVSPVNKWLNKNRKRHTYKYVYIIELIIKKGQGNPVNKNASYNKSLNLRDLPRMFFSDSDRESLKIVPSN